MHVQTFFAELPMCSLSSWCTFLHHYSTFWLGLPCRRLGDRDWSTTCLSGRGSTSSSIRPKKEPTEMCCHQRQIELSPAGTLWKPISYPNRGTRDLVYLPTNSHPLSSKDTNSLAVPVYCEPSHQTGSSRCCLSSSWLHRLWEQHWCCQIHPCRSLDF